MKKTLIPALILAAIAAPWSAFAQVEGSEQQSTDDVMVAAGGMVTIASKGLDVRDVLFDLFSQAKKNFVLQPDIRHVLFLSLAGVEFDEALEVVLKSANLESELQNGIYFIAKKKAQTTAKPTGTPVAARPAGMVTELDFQKRLTTRLAMTDIREVFAEFTKQTGVMIEVHPSVPAYKIDAYLVNTSLKYSLDVITRAAGLTYSKTNNKSILIEKAKAG